MKAMQIRNSLLLLLTAVIWGVAFVAQSAGMEYVGPFTFNASRFMLGGTVLLPVLAFKNISQAKSQAEPQTKPQIEPQIEGEKNRREEPVSKFGKSTLIAGGILCGLALCSASTFQQLGLQYTTVGKAGFITALYIVLVPFFGLFLGRKIRPVIWLGAALAAAGLYLLCMKESLSINKGDLMLLVCAVIFAGHILIIDYFSPRADGVALSCIQFYFSGVISLVLALLLEQPSFNALIQAGVPVLYAGVLSCGVAYTLQIIGQKGLDPTVASLILSLESVVSVLAGWLILGQRLSRRELLGCGIVFAAVILVQLPERRLQ